MIFQSCNLKRDRLEFRIKTLKGQIETLAERISLLPKGMDLTPLITQLEKLQKNLEQASEQFEEEKKLKPFADVPATFNSIADFRKSLIILLARADTDKALQSFVIKKIVHRVKIAPGRLEIFFHIGRDYYSHQFYSKINQLAFSKDAKFSDARKPSQLKIKVACATLLTNGDLEAQSCNLT